MADEPDANISAEPSAEQTTVRGAIATSIYASRKVMHHAVSERELRSVSLMNTGVTAFCSIASFLFAIALSIWIGVIISDKVNDVGEMLAIVVAPILVVLALFFYACGARCWMAREDEIEDIIGDGNIKGEG